MGRFGFVHPNSLACSRPLLHYPGHPDIGSLIRGTVLQSGMVWILSELSACQRLWHGLDTVRTASMSAFRRIKALLQTPVNSGVRVKRQSKSMVVKGTVP